MKYLLLLSSCVLWGALAPQQRPIMIYHHEPPGTVDDGEIWGSQLHLFFVPDAQVHVTTSSSRRLANELQRVQGLLQQTNPTYSADYYPYAYAFILPSADTLYTDTQFQRWRGGHRRARLPTSVNAYLNVAK